MPPRRPACFLDRDGVLNRDLGYTHRPEALEFLSGAVAAVRLLNAAGWLAIVVTNQSGVARGYYTLEHVAAFHAEMQRRLRLEGGWIDAFYVAPWHPEGTVPEFARDHPDRKPGPGMLLRAMAEWPIDPARSFLVGDQPRDLEAAARAGIAGHRYTGGSLAALIRPLLGETPAGG